MKIRNLSTGTEVPATVRTETTPWASYGSSVVLADLGEGVQAVDPVGWQILEASAAERACLPLGWEAP